MKIFILNSGSSSVKFKLINFYGKDFYVLCKGQIERIGISDMKLEYVNYRGQSFEKKYEVLTYSEGIQIIISMLIDTKYGCIDNLKEIDAIGHRVVHGGERFKVPVIIDKEAILGIKSCISMAPLHNPANLDGILACQALFPEIPQVAVFDTSFHHTIPPEAYLYGLPYKLYQKYGIRKYGFHGISHQYVSEKAAEILKVEAIKLKTVSCHLGNGASIAAINHGMSIDTSMGFTPLDGLLMGTRCGEIDPAIIPFLMYKEDMTGKQVYRYLNKESGLLGLSGISGDFRDIEKAAIEGDERAVRALNAVTYRVGKFIGSYLVAMQGIDCIVFTAGIGENSSYIRKKICEWLDVFGVKLNLESNEKGTSDRLISTEDSKIKVLVIKTNEEYIIARETFKLCSSII